MDPEFYLLPVLPMRARDKRAGILINWLNSQAGRVWQEKFRVAFQLVWRISDDISIFLSFNCHGRVLSEVLLAVCFFVCVALNMIASCKDTRRWKHEPERYKLTLVDRFIALNLVSSVKLYSKADFLKHNDICAITIGVIWEILSRK